MPLWMIHVGEPEGMEGDPVGVSPMRGRRGPPRRGPCHAGAPGACLGLLLLCGAALPVALAAPPASPSPKEPAPASSPAGPTIVQVSEEISGYFQFLKELARVTKEGDDYRLVLTHKLLPATQQFTLSDDDVRRIQDLQEKAQQSRFIKVLDQAGQAGLLKALEDMTRPQPAPTGVKDAEAIGFEARRQIDRWVQGLCDALDPVRARLDARQRALGMAEKIPVLVRPAALAPASPSTSASPGPGSGSPPPPASRTQQPPAPLPDEEPGVAAAGEPCSGPAQDAKDLKRDTRAKLVPIQELIGAGERALARRYFEEARDAFEKAADATDDLERKWHEILTSVVKGVSDEARFKPECTGVISISLSQAIALKEILRGLYPKLGRAYLALGNNDQAAEQIRRSTEIDPSNAATWDLLGQAELKRENLDQAVAAFTRSVSLDSYQPDVYVRLARAHALKNEVKRSVLNLRRAVSKGFNRFEEIDADPGFSSLSGDPDFEELVHIAPGVPY